MAVFPGTRGSPALLDRLAEDEEGTLASWKKLVSWW